MKRDFVEEIKLPEKVKATLNGSELIIEGPKGRNSRVFDYKNVKLTLEDNKLTLKVENGNKRDKCMFYTYLAHIKNMIKGVTEGFTYKMKIISGHFPISVSISGDEFIVKNLFGEKKPRKLKLYPDVKVKVEGEYVVLEGINKERVGQQAANIEQLCRITTRDRRIFFDGIYIVEKSGKSV
ncbi:MAG: 50S ribosomal protein L6 [Candidatus Woesearchaeota archaeon]